MGYIVLQYFEDLQDKNHPYRAGEQFPRPGLSVSPERFAELASKKNLRGIPLIAEESKPEEAQTVEEPVPAKKPTSRKKKTAE